MIILIILIIVLLLSLSLINKTLKKKDNILDEVKLQENVIRNDGFALMLQKEDGTYEESTSSTWPTDMVFNNELSGCIDTNGNKIDNSLSFDKSSKVVTLKTNQTSYCYIYFDKASSLSKLCSGSSLGSCLANNESKIMDLWNSPLEDDGYRYVGTDPDNYICFGTNDKDTCLSDTDKYMYRIIGIFEDETGNKHAKLIKKEALNTSYKWNSTYTTDVDWNNSDLYKGLNGSYFLTNTTYSYMQNTDWINKIATWNYTMTNTKTSENSGLDYNVITAKDMYLHELNRSSKPSNVGEWKNLSAKIGLMYASDYALSLGSEALNYTSSSNYSTMKTGWMHISNNDTSVLDSYEWTMSRYGGNDNYYRAWRVYSYGIVDKGYVYYAFAVRPVFYLNSGENYMSGEGTKEDPIMLADLNAPTISVTVESPSSKPYIKITSNENSTYCINKNSSASNFSNCVLSGSLTANTETSTGYFTSSGSYYLHVKDADGNSTIKGPISIEVTNYIGEYILENKPKGFNSTMEGGLYRFQGASGTVNNYICFGTTSKTECLNDKETYLYRIIGINSDKQLKMIKNEPLSSFLYWYRTSDSLITWPNSDIYRELNVTYYNSSAIFNYKTYLVTTDWKYGIIEKSSGTASSIYTTENNWTTTTSTRVGLMYMHDYYYSYQSGGLNCSTSSSTCKNSWLHLSNCNAEYKSESSNSYTDSELIMSQKGEDSLGYTTWFISGNYGSMMYGEYNVEDYVRPVFYLKYKANYSGGTGTISDPYIIK